MAGKVNSGYLMPEKGKGKLNIGGREDRLLVCSWANEDRLELIVQVKDEAKSKGSMKPNNKTSPNQPDWRGRFTDEEGKEWLISAWNRSREDNEVMFGVSITDPATLPPRTNAPASGAPAQAANSASANPPAQAPASDSNAMPPLDNPSDYDFTDIFKN